MSDCNCPELFFLAPLCHQGTGTARPFVVSRTFNTRCVYQPSTSFFRPRSKYYLPLVIFVITLGPHQSYFSSLSTFLTQNNTVPKLRATMPSSNVPHDDPADDLARAFEQQLDVKPPLISTNSAPPVMQTDHIMQEGFTFGTCPTTPSDFVGTPATEKGQFEYPESGSASSSRRSSILHPSLRRGSSTSSTVSNASTITALSTATRRPSLAPAYSAPIAGPSDYDAMRRRGSLAHFPTRHIVAPIPPSLLARRGSLPAVDALFRGPAGERRAHTRASPSITSPILPPHDTDQPRSPTSRNAAFRLRLPPSAYARRGSISTVPALPMSVTERHEPNEPTHVRSRQASTSSSLRGSNLSRSSISSEEAMRDEDESTDETTVDTPSTTSDLEATEMFSDPWKGGKATLHEERAPEVAQGMDRSISI
jgi:hypothetical protein